MNDYKDLITQLKNQKEELGLSQSQIAERMQTERIRVNELLSSRKSNMTVKTLINLCNALQLKIILDDSTLK